MAIEEDDFSIDSEDPERRDDGVDGPPERWELPSWYMVDKDQREMQWYWLGRTGLWQRDPCPARALGTREGEYHFITSFGEPRVFTAGQLHGRGGLPDLFVGSMWWPMRHFRKYDLEKKALVGGIQEKRLCQALMRWCSLKGFYDGRTPYRSVGTWRGPEGRPIVHAGEQIFEDGIIREPGVTIGEALFVRGSPQQAPSNVTVARDAYEWKDVGPEPGRTVAAHLDEFVWTTDAARDLFQGGLHCDLLCSALTWLPHKFVLAPYGSGKSSLLRYARAIAGGAGHAVQKTYSKAYLEQNFAGTAKAFYLDETESDSETDRIKRIFELVRLLSDDGAEGGRGSSGGKSRRLDVHGTVTMAATMTEEWPPQDRSRITLLEIAPFRDRLRPPAPPEFIAAMLQRAAEMSPDLRARAIGRFDLFQENLKVARAAILTMGGQPRDADQLGHLIAGWRTMTSDDPFDPDEHEEFTRFRSFIMSLVESEDGEDAPGDLLNTIFGQVPDLWRSGERMTVGELVALGRTDEVDAPNARKNLARIGLRLEKNPGEIWGQAWLAVANKHPGLDKLLTGHPGYQGKKRSQILKQLQRGAERALVPDARLRFASVQSRYVLIPPSFLPSYGEEAQ